jgi:hypothetical protein
MTEGPYTCKECDPESDITALVIAERDQQMSVLRRRHARENDSWSVIVTCPNGHEVVISSEG